MLNIVDVYKRYTPSGQSPVEALRGVSLSLNPGDFASIRGPSGCGKSTLLLSAGLLQRPDEGRIELKGQDVYALSREERASLRRREVGFVFQQFHLIPYLNLLDNIQLSDCVEPEEHGEERATALAEQLGIAHRLQHTPGELSVGERQRVALARALYGKPSYILADEPTGNLDPDSAKRVLDELAQFAEHGGIVFMVTHDPEAAARATRPFTMNQGLLETPA